jgi:hypothetical protein
MTVSAPSLVSAPSAVSDPSAVTMPPSQVTEIPSAAAAEESSPGNGGANAVLMLHGEGTDESTTFTDSSPSAHTITPSGDVEIDTSRFKHYAGSCKFLGLSNGYLITPTSSDFRIATDDAFTFSCWMYRDRSNTDEFLFSMRGSSVSSPYSLAWRGAGGSYYLETSGPVTLSYTAGQLQGAWHHIAFVRTTLGRHILFVNGVIAAETTNASKFDDADRKFTIGINPFGGWNSGEFQGNLDDIRVAREATWTADFSASLPGPY